MKISLIQRLLSSRSTRLKNLKAKVVDYLSGIPTDKISLEQQQVLDYLNENDIAVFPYSFAKKYTLLNIEIEYDKKNNLIYSQLDGRKLFFKTGSQKQKAKKYFRGILMEQDSKSPHRYLSENFKVNENDVVVDIGAAEGNFSLSVVEKAKHVYIFEPDKKWVKALEATFYPWKEKVTIINKFVSSKTDEQSKTICLDDFFNGNQTINFIKADVEGSEMKLLLGGQKIMQSNSQLKIAICTYHKQEDAEQIEAVLKKHGFDCSFSPGYMLYYYGRSNVVKEPYLRRAILRAEKAGPSAS